MSSSNVCKIPNVSEFISACDCGNLDSVRQLFEQNQDLKSVYDKTFQCACANGYAL